MDIGKIQLNISSDTVCYIILKAHEFHAKEAVTFPEKIRDSENEYDSWQILADHVDDMTFLEIKQVIEDLEPDQKVDLLTLMYIGREDFDIEDWEEARKEARNNIAPRLAEYLFAKPMIADYLSKALSQLGYSCDT